MKNPFSTTMLDGLIRRFLPETVNIVGNDSWAWPAFRMLSCDARDQVACFAAANGWRSFESPMPRFFQWTVEHAGDGMIVDAGANTGFYTLLALTVSDRVRAVAFEPLASARSVLIRNLRLNRSHIPRTRVSVLPYALSDSCGTAKLFVPDSRHGLVETSASLSADFKGDGSNVHTVRKTTLDVEFRQGPRVAVIKIDAEGHDLKVLRGATELMVRDRPAVFVEVLLGSDEAGLTEILQQAGYTDFVLRPDGVSDPGQVVRHDPLAWNHMWLPVEFEHELPGV